MSEQQEQSAVENYDDKSKVDVVDPSPLEDVANRWRLQTAPFDARFPNTNQTRHCFQNYTDYFKCINAKGEDFAPCMQFKRAYNSLCPNSWLQKWDEQRENGTFPASLDP